MVNMMIVFVITLIAVYLLAKLVPIAGTVSTLEQSSTAYYNAISGKEIALYAMDPKNPGYETGGQTITYGSGYLHSNTQYSIIGSGAQFPRAGEGTSDYDADWNALDLVTGIELLVNTNTINWNAVQLHIRVPDVLGTGSRPALVGTSSGIVSWTISGTGKFLTPVTDAQMLTASRINAGSAITLGTEQGADNSTTPATLALSAIYPTLGCDTAPWCTLKFYAVRPFIVSIAGSGTTLPYLEWQITGLNANLPLPEAIISTSGQYRSYLRRLSFRRTQRTTAGVTNFTVYQ